MKKTDQYRNILRGIEEWNDYLLKESGLPGPRANLELLEAVVEEGNAKRFSRYLAYIDYQTEGCALEFLAVCGVAGQGKLVVEGQESSLTLLRLYASDSRWRIREAVAIALQRVGEFNMDLLLKYMEVWAEGSHLEKRAVIAALCEPRLLKEQDQIKKVLKLLDNITSSLTSEEDRKQENFRVLRKTLGYGWSVAVVALPSEGKVYLEKWFANDDKDIRWIMKENLKKDRLMRMDREWTERWRMTMK